MSEETPTRTRALRLFGATLCLAMAGLSASDAMLAFWRKQEPAVAASAPEILRRDPALQLRASELEFGKSEELRVSGKAIRDNAMAALRNSPLDVRAVRQLAVLIALEKGEPAGRTYALLAEKISRRDLQTQFLLVDIEAGAGNLASTLTHYNRALTVHPDARERLYTLLAGALRVPDIRAALLRYADRPWFSDFLGWAAGRNGDPAAIVELLAQVRTTLPQDGFDALATRIAGELAERQDFAQLRALVSQMRGVNTSALDTIGFTDVGSDERLGPLAWNLRNDDAVETARMQPDEIELGVSPSRVAVAAERVTLFAPGEYELIQNVTYDPANPRATLTWDVRCAGRTDPIWKQRMPTSPGTVTYRANFEIPKGCDAQRWQLSASADETQFTSMARVGGLAFTSR